MIMVEFQGGLGNQMFQYAFYMTLKTRYPSVEIKADLDNYKMSKYHWGFEISKIFNINLDIATNWECIKAGKKNYLFSHKGFIKKILNKIFLFILFPIISRCIKTKFIYINESYNDFDFQPELFNLDIKNDYYLSGFWFNELYFIDIKDKLFLDFQFSKSLYDHSIIRDIMNCESVSIHIRRGDFVGTDFDILDMDYYKGAIEYISNKINVPFFYIFSDDIEYAKKEFDYLKNRCFVSENQGNNSYKDMLFMSKCKHNIISNSSFSLWGAYLNKNEGKIVIVPNCLRTNSKGDIINGKWINSYLVHNNWIAID